MGITGDLASIGRLRISRASGSVGLGKYRIFANIGRGGMADVQLGAMQGPKGFHKLVVVKRLRPLLADDASAVNMFLDEARLAARLNHPNVVHTYEFGEEHGIYFIAMEFLEGQPLSEVLHAARDARKEKSFSASVWAKIVAEALAGLHYAHELRDYDGTPLNVVHRDVSPQNIFVTYDGGVKLVDFGIAKAALNATKTESQLIKGKVAYMAPEQADPATGVALDRRADVFAMGIVLWECLAQKRLISGDVRAAVSQIVGSAFDAPSVPNPSVPPELDAITMRALQRDPDARFQTAQAMREALERFLRSHGDLVDETTIAPLVSELFARSREDMQRQIRAEMVNFAEKADLTVEDSSPSERIARAAVSARLAPAQFAPAPAATESVGSLRVVRTSVTSEAKSSARTRRLGVGAAAAAVALSAALALMATSKPSHRTETPPSSTAPLPIAVTASNTERPAPLTEVPATSPPAHASPPKDAGAAASPSAARPAPPPRSTAPPGNERAPKLDDDPWR